MPRIPLLHREMVVDRLETEGVRLAAAPDTDSLEGDLRELLFSLRDLLRHRIVRQVVADLHAEMSRNSELAARVRARLQTERRSRGPAILRRAIARREIAARTDRKLFNDAVAAMI
jgi:hypothetical protein